MSIRLLLQAATYADQPIRQKYHFHNSYELIFIRKGAIRLTVEQKQYIMSAGSLAIISCLENPFEGI
jgi:mannose-6-phosphate isomerase class I